MRTLASERARDRRRRWTAKAAGVASGYTRLYVELLNDAMGLAAMAIRRRESDRAPTEDQLEAERWLFDPKWEGSHPLAAIALYFGEDVEELRERCHGEVRKRYRRPLTKVRVGGTNTTTRGQQRFRHQIATHAPAR